VHLRTSSSQLAARRAKWRGQVASALGARAIGSVQECGCAAQPARAIPIRHDRLLVRHGHPMRRGQSAHHADRVDSVALVRGRVALPKEHVSQVRPAVGTKGFDRAAVLMSKDVALIASPKACRAEARQSVASRRTRTRWEHRPAVVACCANCQRSLADSCIMKGESCGYMCCMRPTPSPGTLSETSIAGGSMRDRRSSQS